MGVSEKAKSASSDFTSSIWNSRHSRPMYMSCWLFAKKPPMTLVPSPMQKIAARPPIDLYWTSGYE